MNPTTTPTSTSSLLKTSLKRALLHVKVELRSMAGCLELLKRLICKCDNFFSFPKYVIGKDRSFLSLCAVVS